MDFFAARHAGPLVEDLRHALGELEALAAQDGWLSEATGATAANDRQ